MERPFVLANSLTDINNISSIQNLKKAGKVLSSVTFIHKSWADVPGDKERYRELAFVNKEILEKRKTSYSLLNQALGLFVQQTIKNDRVGTKLLQSCHDVINKTHMEHERHDLWSRLLPVTSV